MTTALPELYGEIYVKDPGGKSTWYDVAFKELATGPRPQLELVEISTCDDGDRRYVPRIPGPDYPKWFVGSKFLAAHRGKRNGLNMYSISYKEKAYWDKDLGSMGIASQQESTRTERMFIERSKVPRIP